MAETPHPALLTWDQIEAAWESVDSIFETEEMEPEKRALALAQARRVVEYLAAKLFVLDEVAIIRYVVMLEEDWQALRAAVGLPEVR